MSKLPKQFQKFISNYPKINDAYEALGAVVHSEGPLDDKSRALIKLSISIGARFEGAVHSHTRKSLEAGCTKEEIRQTVLLALPTLGMPTTMAAMSWVNDILDEQ